MKNKKLIGIALLLIICGVSIYFISRNTEENIAQEKPTIKLQKKMNTRKTSKVEVVQEKNKNTHKREVASTPASSVKWKSALLNNLNKSLASISATATVKPMGAANLRVGNKLRPVQHVLVSVNKGKGNVSSYEAFVNPKTGTILRTWNQTRFENQVPITMTLKPFRP
ncbi:MAG: hypothetical protein KC478_03655 [Bacteriovoracaceae bacterium]|nr:hypothetical protein [Bacteriovoracaceae bacterium]